MTAGAPARVLRTRDVLALTRLSRATIHRLRAAGQFPQPFRLSPGTIAWRSEVIADWLEQRSKENGS